MINHPNRSQLNRTALARQIGKRVELHFYFSLVV